MGKKYNKRNKLPPFVPLIWDLLNSTAYKALTPSAAKVLPYFLGKVKVGFHDQDKYVLTFSFPYPEANKLGFSSATFSRVCKELVKIGFLEFAEKGGLRGKSKGYTKYRLSRKWESYGKEKPAPFEPIPWPLATPVKIDVTPKVKKKIRIRRTPLAMTG